jgi:hypothetical protein
VPKGIPEIQIRPIDFAGYGGDATHRGVEITSGDTRTVQSTSGSVGQSWLTPDEARHVAAEIIAAADLAEGGA